MSPKKLLVLGATLTVATYWFLPKDSSQTTHSSDQVVTLAPATAQSGSLPRSHRPVTSMIQSSVPSIIEEQANTGMMSALLARYPAPKLTVDVNGNLVKDTQLKLFLEHYTHWLGLEGVSEQPLYELSLQEISEAYDGSLLADIQDIFDRYWHYNLELSNVKNLEEIESAKADFDGHYDSDRTLSLLSEYQYMRQALRDSYFSSLESEQFFGDEDRYDAFFKQSLADGHTENAEKLLSTQQREDRAQSRILIEMKALRREALDADRFEKRHQDLIAQYGEDTAQAMREVQQEQSTWSQKKSDYFSRKDQLNAQSWLSAHDARAELDRIMREELGFSDFEVRRIQALEGRFLQHIN